jgi:hypothetical protein
MQVPYHFNERTFHNWACVNYFKPRYFHQPRNCAEILQILNYARSHGERVKVIGSAHTPNSVFFFLAFHNFFGLIENGLALTSNFVLL